MNRSPTNNTNTTHDTMMAISMGVLMAAASLMYDAPTGMEIRETSRRLAKIFQLQPCYILIQKRLLTFLQVKRNLL
jgi:hypothetical protein